MNTTSNNQIQLPPKGTLERDFDADSDIAEISDELAALMQDFEAKYGRPLSRRDIMWWQGFHEPPRETMNPIRINQGADLAMESAEHAAYIDAISTAAPAGADLGYDQNRLEGGAVTSLVDDTLRETAYDTQPAEVRQYSDATGEQPTGAFARFSAMTKQLPVEAVAEYTDTAERISADMKLMMKDITTVRGSYIGIPHSELSLPEGY